MGYLPGQTIPLHPHITKMWGDMCVKCEGDWHEANPEEEAVLPRFPAVKIVVGETDSFGSEYHPLCQKHLDADQEKEPWCPSTCDWCKKGADKTSPTRDPDEGSNGPVYWVCSPCKVKMIDHSLEEEDYEEEDDEPFCSVCLDDPLEFMDGSTVGACPSCS